jgi:glycosyltransferase involved in cell wall biosynthesis
MNGLIVHEWIAEHGGSENVVDAMHETFPKAEVLCLWNDAPKRLQGAVVHESWMSRSLLRGHKALALPLMSPTWKRTDISSYDWALVSSHLFAHHVAAGDATRGIPVYVYAHTPARYIWEPSLDGRGRHPAIKLVGEYFRRIDKKAAASGAVFAANSHFVRKRIERVWGQQSTVIYPPVNVERLQLEASWSQHLTAVEADTFNSLPDQYILGASRFVTYKNLSKVIEVGEACRLPVVLAGAGPLLEDLKRRAAAASIPVSIVEQPSNEMLYSLYQSALLFVFPPVEDFGIMPVEAMALGTPVLVNSVGGAAESVRLLRGGAELPQGESVAELRESVRHAMETDMSEAVDSATKLSAVAFQQRIRSWMSIPED